MRRRRPRSELTAPVSDPQNLACAIANGASKYEELFFSKVKGEGKGACRRKQRSGSDRCGGS